MTSIKSKTIWGIACPIILGNLAQTLIALTDTAFLGRVSAIALGAAMLANIYYIVFSTLAWGFSTGVQIIIARRLGENKLGRIGVIFEHGMVFVFFLSIGLFLIQHYCTEYLLDLFIQSPNIYGAAMEYMDYRHYGIVFVCFNFLFRALYIGLSNTKVISLSTLLMAVVNICLDYALIFGKWGFPQLGIGGAALASVCAEISAFVFFWVYTLVKLPLKTYALFVFHKLEAWLIKAVLRLAFPTMLQKLFSFGTWFIFFVLVERMGEEPVAISGIIRSVYMLITIPVFAFGATANTLTSRQIGAGLQDEVRSTLAKILRLSLICILPLLLGCILFPSLLLSIYTDDGLLVSASIPTLYVVCLAAVSMSFGMTYFDAVSGTGNTVHALLLEIIVLFVYSASVWFFAQVVHSDVAWVWISEIVYGLLIGTLSFLYLRFAGWHKKAI